MVYSDKLILLSNTNKLLGFFFGSLRLRCMRADDEERALLPEPAPVGRLLHLNYDLYLSLTLKKSPSTVLYLKETLLSLFPVPRVTENLQLMWQVVLLIHKRRKVFLGSPFHSRALSVKKASVVQAMKTLTLLSML